MGTTEIERGKGGRFAKGVSGNPSGRPKARTTELQKQLEGHRPELVEKTIEMALAGDVAALKLLLDRMAPPLKASAAPVEIELPEGGSLADNARAILAAAANGQVPGDVASQLIHGISGIARVVEIDELSERLEALEAMHDE